MSITRLAIDNTRTTLLILMSIIAIGISAYNSMPKDYDPGFIIRTAQVITYFPGASPERVEQLVTDKIEKAVQEIPELDFVASESRLGVSIVKANIKESYKEMRPIWDNLRRKVDAAKADLPEEAQEPIVNDEFGDVYGIVIAMTAEGYSYAEMKEIAKEVKDEFLHLSEAAKVEIYGEQQEQVFVEFNNARLTELGLSSGQIQDQLASRNIIIPGGSISISGERITLEPTGNFESVQDIEKTIIQLPGSADVMYLSEIATITRSYEDPVASKVKFGGEDALSIAIAMRHGGNNLLLGEQVNEVLARINQQYPLGVDFTPVSFMPAEVDKKVDEFVNNLVQAIVVVTIVMLFTLGLRTGLIVAMLIPTTMVSGILLMSLFDISIDQISLAALIIALGMLVDNGIVMSENIMVQMGEGKKPIDAAVDSAAELKVPLLVSSLTTAAAFLPIFLAESATGEYTASLFKVVTITLLCSWLIAMTIIPILCIHFMKVVPVKEDKEAGYLVKYRSILTTLLNNRGATLVGIIALFFIAIKGLDYVPSLFFPPSDRPYFKMEVKLPVGTDIEQTGSIASKIENYIDQELLNEQGVSSYLTYLGSGGPRFLLTHSPEPTSSNYALLIVNVHQFENIDATMKSLEDFAFANFPDAQVKLRKIENGSAVPNPVEVRVYGKDSEKLMSIVADIKAQMASISGLKSINDDWGMPSKKLEVSINQQKARLAGVSSKDIAVSLQAQLSGQELTQYREGDEVIPVLIRSEQADRSDIGKLSALTVYNQSTGAAVPLRQVAEIKVVWESALILRRDRFKAVTVGAQIDSSITASEAFAQLTPWLEEQQKSWPLGFSFELGGEAESSGKANQSIAEKLPIAGFIILLLLVGQFNSFRKCFIVLTTIPLAVIGVVAGLLVAQSFMGFITLLGIISLAGIVINNAIVLLERIQQEQTENGLSPYESIIEAAQRRFRPIMLTTATTVFGMLPLYLGGGEMWEPLAVAIMAGLLFSTVLTLGVIPVLYSLLYRVEKPQN